MSCTLGSSISSFRLTIVFCFRGLMWSLRLSINSMVVVGWMNSVFTRNSEALAASRLKFGSCVLVITRSTACSSS